MKQTLLLISILILNLGSNAQVISKFSWNGPAAAIKKADQGPDASTVSSGAVTSILGLIFGVTNGSVSPGPTNKNIDLTLPNTTYFNVPNMDLSIDFRREETEASFYKRGSTFDFGMTGGKLSVKFDVDNGMGGKNTISSGNVFNIPDDHQFHTYRFMYDNMTGIANVWVDGVSRYNYTGTGNRNLNWTGAAAPVIGDQMDATGRNVGVIDNFDLRATPAAIVLPVKFNSFTAAASSNAVLLKWSTSNESGLKNFSVEKSVDGLHFETISSVAAKGSAVSNEYEIRDLSPVNNSSYRIRSNDVDGNKNYSDVRTINVALTAATEAKITAYPNPAAGALTVSVNSSKATNYIVNLYTQDGRKVQTQSQLLERGSSNINLQFSSAVPHNAMLLVVIETNDAASKQSLRVFRN